MKRRGLILIAAAIAILGIAIALTVRLATPEKVLAWRIRYGYPVELSGVKFHVPPRFQLIPNEPLINGSLRLFQRDGEGKGFAPIYMIETRDLKEPDLKSTPTAQFVRLQSATLAGRKGSCAEFSGRLDVDTVGPFDQRFTAIDCLFGPQIGVRFFGRAKDVSEFHEFIRRAE